jgi:glycolate oxidase
MTSNHVLGLEAVLPTGEVVRLGSSSQESCGPDLLGLYVGAEGLFGVALEITLRLLARPQRVFTLLAAYEELSVAGAAVSAVVASGLLPAAMEIMDRLAIEAAEAAVGAGYPRVAALLIVELEGDADEVGVEAEALRRVIARTGASEMRATEDPAERAAIWKGRKGAFSAVGRLSPDYLVQDGVVPRAKLGQALAEIERLGKRFALRVANVFHAGDGNLHPLILYDGRVKGELERAEELAGEILELCVALGGSITGEHGVGVEKRSYLPSMFAVQDLTLMKRLRDAVDPGAISNPGKVFEDRLLGEAPSLGASAPHPLERAGVISRE